MLGKKRIVPCAVIGNPVDDDIHFLLMNRLHEILEIVHRAEFRIDRAIVAHGVVAAESAFAIEFADGMNRHQPEDFHTHRFQAGELLLKLGEGAVFGVLPDIHFIDRGIRCPFGMCDMRRCCFRIRGFLCGAGSGDNEDYRQKVEYEKLVVHDFDFL
jgi:hypothetical protein